MAHYNIVLLTYLLTYIDSVVWAQYRHVKDSHVAIANAAPMHCIGRQKTYCRRITQACLTRNISIDGLQLKEVCEFCYFGTVISRDGRCVK